MALLKEYFTTKQVGLAVVFACVCWLRSVEGLQGEGGIRRNVGFTVDYTLKVERILRTSITNGEVRNAASELHDAMAATVQSIRHHHLDVRRASYARRLVYANPMLAACDMVRVQFDFLRVGYDALEATSRFRACFHLYAALVNQRLLDRLPFVDGLLETFEATVFTPSRAAATQGSYTKVYLISIGMNASRVDGFAKGSPQPLRPVLSKARDRVNVQDLSSAYRIMVKQDVSMFAKRSASYRLENVLSRVADECGRELRDSRVLSLDVLRLHDDIADLFEKLCDGLGRC